MTLNAFVLAIVGFLLVLDFFAIVYILYVKISLIKSERQKMKMSEFLIARFEDHDKDQFSEYCNSRKKTMLLLERYIELRQEIIVGSKLDIIIKNVFVNNTTDVRFSRRLNSMLALYRIEAAVYLGHIATPLARIALETRIEKEHDWLVRMYIAHALTEIGDPSSLMVLIDSLVGSPDWYQQRVKIFIAEFGHAFKDRLSEIISRREKEIRLCIIYFATEYIDKDLRKYLLVTAHDTDPEIVRAVAEALYYRYPIDLNTDEFLNSDDPHIKGLSILSLGKNGGTANIEQLIEYLNDDTFHSYAQNALVNLLYEIPRITDHIVGIFDSLSMSVQRERLIKVLSSRADFFIMRLQASDGDVARRILKEMVIGGQVNAIIGFLGRNSDIELENDLLTIVKSASESNANVNRYIRTSFDDRFLKKMKLQKIEEDAHKRKHKPTNMNRTLLIAFITGAFCLFPIMFTVRHFKELSSMSNFNIVETYVLDGNYYLIFYSFAISFIYLSLLLLSAIGAIKQRRYSRVKKRTFLFRKKVLPSITIIAPAYNEELTILESINSLLNISYPDYEILVVNDGSQDKTLVTLIDYYSLEKVDVYYEEKIATNPVRGIYRNKSLPRLTVINKANGGKADSLNAGINLSSKDYFCGIDADSLLDQQALLKIVSCSLDVDKETIAVGGNIFPVNGCTVSHGVLETIGMPKSPLATLQFVEYIRAFMAGRIGWSALNSLLIISGAFGLFYKKRVIECGGYLTASGMYGQDTVGEDMELVVRLTRYMRENKLPYSVNYSYNANCWTEVPEKLSTLLRQRDRWHRGLIEILSFHGDLFMNPRYGRVGLFAVPYFYVFEMIGPWIEFQGYVMVLIALFIGLLNVNIAVLLFLATVMLGLFISIASLIIAEQEVSYFKIRDIFRLVGFAVLENFGWRQFISMWRVMGNINVLRGTAGWGKMTRTGFAKGK